MPWLTLGLAVALVAKFAVCESNQAERDCRQTAKVATEAVIVLVCQEEYARTTDPQAGALLANALRRSNDLRGATAVANALLSTPARADALQVLGKIAYAEKRYQDSLELLQRASELHAKAMQWSGEARDLLALSTAHRALNQNQDALAAITRGIQAARLGDDQEAEVLLRVEAARLFSELGHFSAAKVALDRAAKLDATPKSRAWIAYDLGNLNQEASEFHQCVAFFQKALEIATQHHLATPSPRNIHLELADCLTETGDLELARDHLQLAKEIDTNRNLEADRITLEGQLAFRRGDLDDAERTLRRAFTLIVPEELTELAHVAVTLSRIALKRGILDQAESWARVAIANITQAQALQPRLLFRSLLLTHYRVSHELLFLALARANRTEAVPYALDEWWQRGAFLGLTPDARSEGGYDLTRVAAELSTLATVQASLTRSRGAAPPPDKAGVDSNAPLVALVVADDELWRVSSDHGSTRITGLGNLSALTRRLLDRMRTSPLDQALATELGRLVIPAEFAIASTQPLRLLLDEALVNVPFEAMRIAGKPLVALRPLLRVTRALDQGCVPRAAPRQVRILADAQGDLPRARLDAELLATQFKTTSLVGQQVTKRALLSTASLDLIHVAVHGESNGDGGMLQLADGKLASTDIVTQGDAPSLVVLAACTSAVAQPGLYSMATAYLAAGAQQVIGTLRPVSDEGAALLSRMFYEAGGAVDPVRALAKVQAQLAATANQDWPFFAAFGRDTCNSPR